MRIVFSRNWRRQSGFCALGIHIRLFGAIQVNFAHIFYHLFDFHAGESNSLLPQIAPPGPGTGILDSPIRKSVRWKIIGTGCTWSQVHSVYTIWSKCIFAFSACSGLWGNKELDSSTAWQFNGKKSINQINLEGFKWSSMNILSTEPIGYSDTRYSDKLASLTVLTIS